MYMYFCEIQMDPEKMEEIQKKIHGKSEERERIKVGFYDYTPSLIMSSKSGVLMSLVQAYETYKKKKW